MSVKYQTTNVGGFVQLVNICNPFIHPQKKSKFQSIEAVYLLLQIIIYFNQTLPFKQPQPKKQKPGNIPGFCFYFEKVKSGKGMISPPFMADSWARIPTQVILADCRALG